MFDMSLELPLSEFFATQPHLEFVVWIGSRALGSPQVDSDWDFALQWNFALGFMEKMSAGEELRNQLAAKLKVSVDKIDLIDLVSAGLTMRAVVAEEGVILKGEKSIAWQHFLQRTWRELEEHYWEKIYAI